MKKCLAVIGVLVMVSSAAQGISQGPGGRIYMTEDQGANVGLLSILIDENWDPIGAPAAAQESHGTIANSRTSNNIGISPELESAGGGSAGYADLIMGVGYNSTPSPAYPGRSYCMDVVRVAPSSGSNTVTVLGDGRASTKTGWYSMNSDLNPNTENGDFGIPDPAGDFTGTGMYDTQEDYYYTTGYDRYRKAYINTDYFGDADCTDNVEDYVADSHQSSENGGAYTGQDIEIKGNRAYHCGMYMSWPATTNEPIYPRTETGYIGYMEATQDVDGRTTDLTPQVWYRGGTKDHPDRVPGGSISLSYSGAGGIAAGEVKDGQGVSHEATWVSYCVDNDGVAGLALFADYNDDGDAMDDGESMLVYTAAMAGGVNGIEDPVSSWDDLELIEHDGKKFLMIVMEGNYNGGWYQRTKCGVFVIELQDNGSYVPGSFHVVVRGTTPGTNDWTGWGFSTLSWDEIEFDPDVGVIPEPGTVLLIGTGLLGCLGYIRRRRMK